MQPVIFTQPARTELIGAQDWYENEATGLGSRFRAAADATIQRMSSNPRQFPIVDERASAAPCSAASHTL